jgi:hypothetical protein
VTVDDLLVQVLVVLGSGVVLVLILSWYICGPDDR